MAYLGEKYKVAFPINASGVVRAEILDSDDRPVADREAVKSAVRPATMEIMRNLTRFSRAKH